MRKKILLKFEDDDDVGIFYEDGTYRYKSWPNSDCSQWKIVDGVFYYRHKDDKDFGADDDDTDNKVLVAELIRALNEVAEKQLFK